ncbi:MAG: DUF1727 domain-containing protein [Ruminococcaceae bacterium]|nr:DUF1727 domain-containing protein [Oscillospiraceae bacterium]
MPGKIALKLFPDILAHLKYPDTVIAVTGSNGKTSTVEMIAHVFRAGGLKVAYNKEGSNQTEGVATFLLMDSTLGGRIRSDAVLLESDERYMRRTFHFFHPRYLIITNLYRDQMTRNGHPEWIYNIIKRGLHDDMTLVLNADDPLVSKFGAGREGTLYFGADHLEDDTVVNDSIYDDGKYCPICMGPMEYEYYHYNHIGKYHCTSCGFARPDTRWSLTGTDLEEGNIVINGEYKIPLTFNGIYHCYNTLAAFAAGDLAGIPKDTITKALGGYFLKNGRIVDFKLGKCDGRLLLSKHENSVSYDRSIDVVIKDPKKVNVMIIVDAISRKYFTSDSSWLWDIDFEKLKQGNVEKIFLAGKYCNDLAVRFEAAGIGTDKIGVFESISDAAAYAGTQADFLYVITCFSDKEKILSLVKRKELS